MEKKKSFKKILQLFLIFLKIGAFTFGGGYAMIPIIQKETVENKRWISDDDILEIIAIAESTPGPIAINAATFVGYRVAGFFGALCATLGVVLPSLIIIMLISTVLDHFSDLQAVRYAFYGIRAGVLALVFKALANMYKKCPKNAVSYVVIALAFGVVAFANINAVYVIITCGLIGLLTSLYAQKKVTK